MAVEATQKTGAPAPTSATAAIRKASQVTGARFGYLLATAKVESNLNPNAAASTSSAGGLFQFIDRTWLGTLKEAGPQLGYGRYADAITRSEDGRYTVADPAMRREIMALRQDATANALMAGVFTNSNAKRLTGSLGRAPTDGELYIAHFMGANGAARLIGMSERNPTAAAADAFPTAARANRSIFFDRTGRARNFAEVTQNLTGRYNVARARMPGIESAEAAQAGSFVTETARVAQAYQATGSTARIPHVQAAAAPGERVFSNPYRASERRQPVSQTVADLWTNPNRTSQQEAARQLALSLEGNTRPQQPQNSQPQAPQQYVTQAQAPETASSTVSHTTASHGALGLFQDTRPDVRSLFTHGVRG